MDFNEVIAKENVLARTTARLIYSTQFHIPHNRRKSFFWGEIAVTGEHLCFRLNLRTFKYRIIMSTVIMILMLAMHGLMFIWRDGESIFEYFKRIDTLMLYFLMSILFPIILIFSNKIKKKLDEGFVWDRNKVDITINGTELTISKGEDITGFSLDDESHDVISVLRDQSVIFEIPGLSKLSYHEKLKVLEMHYESGKMSEEIYEELKRRIPYT